jgi:hypothetical protein
VWRALTDEQALAAWFPTTIDGDGTMLELTVELDQLGKATRDSAGWHQCLDSLQRSLAGDPQRPDDADRWRALRDTYADRFGPEASALGPPPGVHVD